MSNADNQLAITRLVSSVLVSIGVIFSLSPLVLYWFIHGDYERYRWIISGPTPFNHFGGGPFQVAMYGGLLLAGVVLIAIGILVRKQMYKTATALAVLLAALAGVVWLQFGTNHMSRVQHERAIEAQITEAKSCEVDADCAVVSGQCPFSCHIIVNKDNADDITAAIDDYKNTDYGQACYYSCTPPPEVACVSGQCEALVAH